MVWIEVLRCLCSKPERDRRVGEMSRVGLFSHLFTVSFRILEVDEIEDAKAAKPRPRLCPLPQGGDKNSFIPASCRAAANAAKREAAAREGPPGCGAQGGHVLAKRARERELVKGSSRRAGSPRRRRHPKLHVADVAGKRRPRTVGSPGGGILGWTPVMYGLHALTPLHFLEPSGPNESGRVCPPLNPA